MISYVQKAHVPRQFEIRSVGQCFVIEVGPHVVCNGNDKCSQLFEVTIETRGLFVELKFDHVSPVAEVTHRQTSREKFERVRQ